MSRRKRVIEMYSDVDFFKILFVIYHYWFIYAFLIKVKVDTDQEIANSGRNSHFLFAYLKFLILVLR